jgi:hypothetical protein
MIRGIAAWLLAMVLLASASHAHGGVGMVDKRCVLRIGPDISSPDTSRKIPGTSFATISQAPGKWLSRSICKNPSSATSDRNPPHQG